MQMIIELVYSFSYFILIFTLWFSLFNLIYYFNLNITNKIKNFIKITNYLELTFIIFIFIYFISIIFNLFFYLFILFSYISSLQYSFFVTNPLEINTLNINSIIETLNSKIELFSLSSNDTSVATSINNTIKPITISQSEEIINSNSNSISNSSNNTSTQPNANNNISYNNATDSIIVAAGISAAAKLALQQPTVTGKTLAVIGVLASTATMIAAKFILGNVSSNIGKSTLLTITDIVIQYLSLTGDSPLDLLIINKFVLNFSLYLIISIIYNFLLLFININTLEYYLLKVFPAKFVNFYIRSVIKLQKVGKYLIILLLIILFIFLCIGLYTLGFFIDNYDSIIDFYIKTKTK